MGTALRTSFVALLCCLPFIACGQRATAPSPPALVSEGAWIGFPESVRDDFGRGINTASWFTHRGDPKLQPGWPDAADLQQMRRLGLRHVRILLDPDWLHLNAAHPRYLEAALKLVQDSGLLAILAMQPESALKLRMGQDDTAVEELAGYWTELATTYAAAPVDRLVFEVLNEPEIEDIRRAMHVQQRLIDAVRAVTPGRVVVVGGAHFSDATDLAAFKPLDARGVIYSFHFYEPHNFTHQGATWGWPMWMLLRDLPYPSSPEAVAPVVPRLAEIAREHAAWYGQEQWNKAKLAPFIQKVAAWSKTYRVPVWCSEFGVRRDAAPTASRRAWLTDARGLFEEQGIAWTYFDWWGQFGLVTGVPGARTTDEDARVGLGLE